MSADPARSAGGDPEKNIVNIADYRILGRCHMIVRIGRLAPKETETKGKKDNE